MISVSTAAATLLLAVACLTGTVSAHARFVCPMPMNGNSGNKGAPCGKDDSGQYTVVAPGPMTVRFEETVFHQGAPTAFRLFRRGDRTRSCLLLDHMPHADNWPRGFFGCGLNFGSFPVGICQKTTGYVTINIPDVDCDDCVLQMVSVMTDKYSQEQKCVEVDLAVNCSTYYSCANLKILGKDRSLNVCSRYEDNLAGSWPYKHLVPGVYSKGEGANEFTPAGWLSIANVDSDNSIEAYQETVTPEGPCAPTSLRYAVTIHHPDDVVGVFSVTVNDVHLFISGAASLQIDEAWLQTSAGAVITVPKSAVQDNYISAAVRSTAASGPGEIRSLQLKFKDGRVISAPLTPAVATVSLREKTSYYGEIVYTADGRRSAIIVNKLASVESLFIVGPARRSVGLSDAPMVSTDNTILEKLEGELQRINGISWFTGDWNALTGSKELTASDRLYPTLAYFWSGRAQIRLTLNSSDDGIVYISRRIPRPAECRPPQTSDGCRLAGIFSLQPKGGTSSGGPAVPVVATGSVVFEGQSYTFTIVLENIRNGETVTSVEALGSNVGFIVVPGEPGDDVIVVAGEVRLSTAAADLEFVVTTTSTSYRGIASPANGATSATSATTQSGAMGQPAEEQRGPCVTARGTSRDTTLGVDDVSHTTTPAQRIQRHRFMQWFERLFHRALTYSGQDSDRGSSNEQRTAM